MKRTFTLLFLFFLGLSSYAQQIPSDNSWLNGYPNGLINGDIIAPFTAFPPSWSEVDPELAAVLQETLDSLNTEYGGVGLSAALILPNGDVWKGTAGINSQEPGDTLSTEMQLGMGSVTKTFTGAAIMQLVEEGVLTVEDTIGQWLPAYPNVKPSITIRHLLNHTSGIYNYTDNPQLWQLVNTYPDSVFTPDYVLNNMVLNPVFPTGATWGYSNTNYALLGLIIEAATGNEYHQEIRNRFFDPLELNTMSLHPQEMPTGPFAHLWTDINGDNTSDDHTALGISRNSLFSMAWAAGALLSTPEDLAHWIKELMTGGVVEQGTLDAMQETVTVAGNFSYGLSLMRVDVLNTDWWGHSGGIGYQTWALYSPELDISMVLMTHDALMPSLDVSFFTMIIAYLQFQPTADNEVMKEQVVMKVSPNPFSDEARIEFELEKAGPVEIVITHPSGQAAHHAKYERMDAGMNVIRLTESNSWPTGIYQVEIRSPEGTFVKRVVKY